MLTQKSFEGTLSLPVRGAPAIGSGVMWGLAGLLVGAALAAGGRWLLDRLTVKKEPADEAGFIQTLQRVGGWNLAEDFRENEEYLDHLPEELVGGPYTILPDRYLNAVRDLAQGVANDDLEHADDPAVTMTVVIN